jgi:hypothetical protein
LQEYAAAPVPDLNTLAVAEEYNAPIAEEPSSSYAQPAPGQYQATGNANELAEEVQSGSVYVQPSNGGANDELYFIYYEDPATGVTTAPQIVSNPAELVDPLFYPGAPQEVAPAAQPESFRTTSSSSSFRIQVNGQQHGFENKQ